MTGSEIKVIKKDGTREDFNIQKVVVAVHKSAERAMIRFSQDEITFICRFVEEKVEKLEDNRIPIFQMHNLVEGALERVNPAVAKSYRDYRNYKQDFVQMLDDVYKKSQSIMYIGDKENSNTDSALVSTKRSLIFNELNKSLYQKFFMTVEELQACRDGYLYIHDMSARRDTMNCCLFDVRSVLSGGFEMGNLWYNSRCGVRCNRRYRPERRQSAVRRFYGAKRGGNPGSLCGKVLWEIRGKIQGPGT